MKQIIFKIENCAVLLILFAAVSLNGQHKLKNGVLGCGGGAVTGADIRMTGTAGQVIIGKTEGFSYHSGVGFWSCGGILVTVVDQEPYDLPAEFRLEQNYPNPFNPCTSIFFSLPMISDVRLEIFNVLGQKVRTLISDCEYKAGRWVVYWDGRDDRDIYLSSGIYFYHLKAGDYVQTLRMMMMR